MIRALSILLIVTFAIRADDKPAYNGVCTATVDTFFVDEVWAKVGSTTCLTCHKTGGDAEKSKFILLDPQRVKGQTLNETMRQNREAFARMAQLKEKDQPRLLLKATGSLEHGGADVLKPDSTGYRILGSFVRRANAPSAADLNTVDPKAPPFFDGIAMLDNRHLLRRVTLSLAGRLPTAAEIAAVGKDSLKAMPAILDALMKEEAFYDRLREGFNDIFLTTGLDGNADTEVLSYDHFGTTRLWYQKHDLSHIADDAARRKAGYKLADDYRKALLGEPMKLVEHIVRNDKPFTEIVTADYIMLTPYGARGYGCFDKVKDQFEDADDPFEYIPVKLMSLVSRNKNESQDSATGFYPHAGLLSTFQYLRRYPTTETNRNRARARMYYQHFLGVDVLELAARVSDAAAVAAKYEIPTMQASECVVCHKTLDPVAGLFQDYWKFEAAYGKRKGGWFQDMFGPGFEGEPLPPGERWRSLQWLGERTAEDPRFAIAMVQHVYYILTGRKVLLPPKDLDDPQYAAKRRAYQEQRRVVEEIAVRFAKNKFNIKGVFQDWILSDFYRADFPAAAITDARRRAELDDIGLVRLLAPEQVERKIAAIFGERWGKLNTQMAMLYGGIDSKEVTERATDPSGAMGAIQRILSNDIANLHVARDFARPTAERRFFAAVELTMMPNASPETDAAISSTIVHLHEAILGRSDDADVLRTVKLFAGIVSDGVAAKRSDTTLKAWRGVVTYLLRRHEFLYE